MTGARNKADVEREFLSNPKGGVGRVLFDNLFIIWRRHFERCGLQVDKPALELRRRRNKWPSLVRQRVPARFYWNIS